MLSIVVLGLTINTTNCLYCSECTYFSSKFVDIECYRIRMIGSLALLIVSFVKLDSKWCSALVQRVSSFVLIIRLFGY